MKGWFPLAGIDPGTCCCTGKAARRTVTDASCGAALCSFDTMCSMEEFLSQRTVWVASCYVKRPYGSRKHMEVEVPEVSLL